MVTETEIEVFRIEFKPPTKWELNFKAGLFEGADGVYCYSFARRTTLELVKPALIERMKLRWRQWGQQ